VTLPLKENSKLLPTNGVLAVENLRKLINRLRRKNGLLEE
jgi:hypothetical protein